MQLSNTGTGAALRADILPAHHALPRPVVGASVDQALEHRRRRRHQRRRDGIPAVSVRHRLRPHARRVFRTKAAQAIALLRAVPGEGLDLLGHLLLGHRL